MSHDYIVMSSVVYEGVDLHSRNRAISTMDLPWTPADLAGDGRIQAEPEVDFGVDLDLEDLDALARSKATRAKALRWAREDRAWAKGDRP
ncbi:MAG: hypothetical protein R3B09_35705 [Nannocystaceae bacterium]